MTREEDEEGVPLNVDVRQLHVDIPAFLDQGRTRDLGQLSLELAADEVFWMLPDSRIVFVNQSACEKLGYLRSELVGMYVWEWDPLFPRQAWPGFLEKLRCERSVIFETKHRNKSGHVFPVEIRGFLVECDGAEFILAFVTDITERVTERLSKETRHRELELLVRARTNELEQFVYRTSHDLRAPLVTVTHLADFILSDLADGDSRAVEENANKVKKLARRLSNLVNDMLHLVKAELGHEVTEDCNVSDVLEDARRSSVDANPNTDVVVRVEISPACRPSIRVERIRLQQVLSNLISNGIKYRKRREERAFVTVRCESTPDAFVISVRDNGLGFPEEARDKIFASFSRFHPEVADGSGLGLSIVKQHIDKMGATIAVESSEQGTTFTLTIPQNGSAR